MMASVDPVAELVVSVAAIVGTLAFVICCLLGLTRRAWLFVRGIGLQRRERPVSYGFEVLPAKDPDARS